MDSPGHQQCQFQFVRCWWTRESVLRGSLHFRTLKVRILKVLTLCESAKVKQRYLSTLTIIPLHNTLSEPQYYWELMLYMAFGFCSIFSSHIVLTTFFVANMNPGRNWLAVIVITVIGAILNIITTLLYYFIWVNVLELHAPMPMGLYIPGSLTVIGGIGLSWFRYYRIFVYIFHS